MEFSTHWDRFGRWLGMAVLALTISPVLAGTPDSGLLEAIASGSLKKARISLSRGADVNAKNPAGDPALFLALAAVIIDWEGLYPDTDVEAMNERALVAAERALTLDPKLAMPRIE